MQESYLPSIIFQESKSLESLDEVGSTWQILLTLSIFCKLITTFVIIVIFSVQLLTEERTHKYFLTLVRFWRAYALKKNMMMVKEK